jgi:2-haloacid dehalogenase
MSLDRRTFLALAGAGLASNALGAIPAPPAGQWTTIRVVVFDAFPIFDPRPIALACEAAFPDRGTALADLWRTRQFEYQWLRTLGGRYEDFWQTTQSALEHAADALQLPLPTATRDALMNHYLSLNAWPDAAPALRAIKASGRQLAFLSNATPRILEAGIANAGLRGLFDHVISTDRIRSFKPDPRAYQLGVDVLGVRKDEILFVAFAGWDAAGAKWFGYPTFWNNRQNAAADRLGTVPDGVGALADLARALAADART